MVFIFIFIINILLDPLVWNLHHRLGGVSVTVNSLFYCSIFVTSMYL